LSEALAIRLAGAGEERRNAAAAGRVAAAPSLWLSRLALTAFRSYAVAELELTPQPVVLTGPNGAGKTNLLEALSLLSPGRGLRRARLGELGRLGDGAPWAVAATLETPGGRRQLGTGRDPEGRGGEGERRVVRLDGRNEKSQAALADLLDVVWLTPQMDSLWRDGAGERRRFLDRLVYGFDPAHAGRVAAYETALRERLRLLVEGRRDAAWLTALEAEMAGRAVAIAAARRALVGQLAAASAAAVGPFPPTGLPLAGAVESWPERDSALAVEERLAALWHAGRGEDAAAGSTALGPHRSDLKASHLAKGLPAELCSTGEQKALLVAVVLAHARLVAALAGRTPLLLLDEVAAHLDAACRAALFEEILALGAQAWLTGTDAETFAGLEGQAQRFTVAAGTVRSH